MFPWNGKHRALIPASSYVRDNTPFLSAYQLLEQYEQVSGSVEHRNWYKHSPFFFGATAPPPSPKWARASSFMRFLDHTQRRTTVGRTPLDEWSIRRRDLYLTTHNTRRRTDIHAPGGIRTHSLSRRADADLRIRPRGHVDRHSPAYAVKIEVVTSLKGVWNSFTMR